MISTTTGETLPVPPADWNGPVALETDAWRDNLDAAGWDALILRGNECGGWCGDRSALILCQQTLACEPRTAVLVRGGVGVRGAAGLRAAGAAGVVLDDQLLCMPEAGLPATISQALARMNGTESETLGLLCGHGCRVGLHPRLPGGECLRTRSMETTARHSDDADARLRAWREAAGAAIAWRIDADSAWPLGQGIGLAETLAEEYGSTGRLVQAIRREANQAFAVAARADLFGADSPMAAALGTDLPLVQGPMAHVSDNPAFAKAVAEAGALPFLALSSKSGDEAKALLRETSGALGGRPWGVGLLGFLDADVLEEQLAAVTASGVRWAIIGGGRPQQARRLADSDITAFLHVPVPSLLKRYLQQGARHFVLEGRECGGHIGPLNSLVLWESMIRTVLAEAPAGELAEVHLLFAGGVHDSRTGALLAAMAAPLIERGVRVGVSLGTAYLFTEEVVDAGAILPKYRDIALACTRTAALELGGGHANRVASGDFAECFDARARALLAENADPETRSRALIDFSRGSLRLAAKGSGPAGAVAADEEAGGSAYMMGEVAALCRDVCTVPELHRRLAEGTRAHLDHARRTLPAETLPRTERPEPLAIAVIGMSIYVPGAGDSEHFWRNMLDLKSEIREVPEHYWDWRLFYNADRKNPDSIYSRWGGFIEPFAFDPLSFGIPPKSLKSICPNQLLALKLTRDALADAGYDRRDFDRDRVGTIFATSEGGGFLSMQYVSRVTLSLVQAGDVAAQRRKLARWSEESFPGVLTSIVAGRVANRFDFGGPNFTVDAACASSLCALDQAVRELAGGRSDMVVCGGVELNSTPHGFVNFSRTQALSPTGECRAFDRKADGILIGEGGAVLILKRLEDAERDGDRIDAVIRAVGSSSDGRVLGLTAPNTAGQQRTLRRAYEQAGFPPNTIRIYEAHGTGTPVGDRSEAESITAVLREENARPRNCVVGTAKSLIGHTKTAAGMVGMVKTLQALRYRVHPPQGNVDEPLEFFTASDAPAGLLRRARPWLAEPGLPRRAGVSAFGFGGTNSHVVLEEYDDPLHARAVGATIWPAELFLFRAEDVESMRADLPCLLDALAQGAHPSLAELALLVHERAQSSPGALRGGFTARSLAEARESLLALDAHLADGAALPGHVFCGQPTETPTLAFLFPGQGSQRPGMLQESALYLEPLRQAVEEADAALATKLPDLLGRTIWPLDAYTKEHEDAQTRALTDTSLAQPAIGALSLGLLRLLRHLGVEPAMVAGHSYGEYPALAAAGVLGAAELFALSAERGRLMSRAGQDASGAMLAVLAAREEVARVLAGCSGVVLANCNAPKQFVLSGSREAIEQARERCEKAGLTARALPVDGAFHSPLMRPVQEAFAEALDATALRPPTLPVFGNVTAAPLDSRPEAMRPTLARQICAPVRFIDTVEAMNRAGATIFLEVGPGNVLTRLVGQILHDRPHVAIALDGRDGLRSTLAALGRLWTLGVPLRLDAFFRRRPLRSLGWETLREETTPAPLSPTTWLIDGCNTRAPGEPPHSPFGEEPLFTSKTRAQAAPATDAAAPAAASNDPAVAAYLAYQETMRRFLALQEQVMQQALDGSGDSSSAVPALPTLPDMPDLSPPPAKSETPLQAPEPPAATADETPPRDVAGSLRRLISERTGYPAEVLRPEIDLEAELGVDSIKRVEIVEDLAQTFPGIDPEALQRLAAELSSARTLQEMAALLQGVCRESPGSSATEPPRLGDNAVEEGCSREALFTLLQSIVAERTGYPHDTIRLELDLEAELGIDSIKRVEMLEELHQSLPPRLATVLGDNIETLGRARSLREIVDALAVADEPAAEQEAADEPGECVRAVMQAVPAPVETFHDLPAGTYLLSPCANAVRSAVADAIRAAGGTPRIIPPAAWENPDEVARLLAEQDTASLRGLVHLSALDCRGTPWEKDAWRRDRVYALDSFYRALQTLAVPLARGRVLALSRMGGAFGRDGWDDGASPFGGGCVGVLKSVSMEMPGLLARAVDLPLDIPTETVGRIASDELRIVDSSIEIGYPGGTRHEFLAGSEPVRDSGRLSLPEQAVVLATGGAQGITAYLLTHLARPGLTLHLLGRTPYPEADLASYAGLDDPSLRRRLVEETKGAPDPGSLEWRARTIRRQIALAETLARLRQRGATVRYHALDARNDEALEALIEEAGPLHAVIHGAGVIEDKLLAQKTPASFDRVLGTKLDCARVLLKALNPEALRLLVFFTSVAGRFGNAGQSDYAAANEILCRLAWSARNRFPNARTVALNWGPWRDIGMARNLVLERFLQRGIRPVVPETGARFFLNELALPHDATSEVVAGAGPWLHSSAVKSLQTAPA